MGRGAPEPLGRADPVAAPRIDRHDFALREEPSLRSYGRPKTPRRSVIEAFVLTSGTFGIVATFLLVYLALRSVRDAKDLRLIQGELAGLMRETKELAEELHELQREIHREQRAAKTGIDETKRTVEQVTEVVEYAAEQVVEVAEHVADAAVKRRRRLIRRMLALGAAD